LIDIHPPCTGFYFKNGQLTFFKKKAITRIAPTYPGIGATLVVALMSEIKTRKRIKDSIGVQSEALPLNHTLRQSFALYSNVIRFASHQLNKLALCANKKFIGRHFTHPTQLRSLNGFNFNDLNAVNI